MKVPKKTKNLPVSAIIAKTQGIIAKTQGIIKKLGQT